MLRAIFINKQAIKSVYLTTFLDSIVCIYTFKLISASSGLAFILAFALGRIAGIFLGNLIDKRLAIGLLEITVYKHVAEGKLFADQLRSEGYSVTTEMGYGIEGKNRLILIITVNRRDFPELKDLILKSGKVNMSIKNVMEVYGKIGKKHINQLS